MKGLAIADTNTNEGEATAVTPTVVPAGNTIDKGAAIKDESRVDSVLKVEETTTIDEMMKETEAAAVAAGSDFSHDNVEGSTTAKASVPEDNKTHVASDAKKEIPVEQMGDSVGVVTAVVNPEPSVTPQVPSRETKKRVRRVGRTPTRKIPKLEEKVNPPLDVVNIGDNNNPHMTPGTVDVATDVIVALPDADVVAVGTSTTIAIAPPQAHQAVLSKHDEKWHAMFQKLMEFKERNKHTLVPQCYTEDPRLGRWVHYQRVEYWIFQQKGTAKITVDRIARLNSIGFEWDPQKAQWEKMFAKLKEFKKEFSHCRVPKGYDKDWELANWVRNQRLEQANLKKEGKKSRMTPERFKLLDDLGFKWSSPTPARARRNRQVGAQKVDESNNKEEKVASDSNAVPMSSSGNLVTAVVPVAGVPTAVPPNESVVASNGMPIVPNTTPTTTDGKAMQPSDAEKAEALSAAATIVGDLSAVEASVTEENDAFLQETAETKAIVEEATNDSTQNTMSLENENTIAPV